LFAAEKVSGAVDKAIDMAEEGTKFHLGTVGVLRISMIGQLNTIDKLVESKLLKITWELITIPKETGSEREKQMSTQRSTRSRSNRSSLRGSYSKAYTERRLEDGNSGVSLRGYASTFGGPEYAGQQESTGSNFADTQRYRGKEYEDEEVEEESSRGATRNYERRAKNAGGGYRY
jgi:hypothetical protein